jgi:hypothetical protein
MKRLAILAVFAAVAVHAIGTTPAHAGELDSFLAVGPSFTSLGEISTAVARFDAIIALLNAYSDDAGGDVSGSVEPIGTIGEGLSIVAGERYWVLPGFALGIGMEYSQSRDGTSGAYRSREGQTITESNIDIQVVSRLLAVALDIQAVVLDIGAQLGVGVRLGYALGRLDVSSTFEVPEGYPDRLAGIPPDLDERYTGGAFGGELAITVSLPLASWLSARTEVGYRMVPVQLTNDLGVQLDFDGDGSPERISLSGFVVRIGFSLRLDLSTTE